MRAPSSSTIVVATSNRGKLAELERLLADLPYTLVTQGDLGIDDAVEDGLSFVENALIKARHAARISGFSAIADDSGLTVAALNGAPGIYSARYAGVHGDDHANNTKLLASLSHVEADERVAHFICAAVFVRHADDPIPIIAQGRWQGRVLESPQGEGGFGYDPLFWVDSHQCSAAELAPDVKNNISHRGRAINQLVKQLISA